MSCLLAKAWNPSIDPTGYWMSEKMDGVRAIWTGTKLVTRTGKTISAPEWFVEKIPTLARLDGELWAGPGNFQTLVSTVRKNTPIDKAWQNVKYHVFDDMDMDGIVFEQRQDYLLSHRWRPPWIQIVPQIKCKGFEHLKATLEAVELFRGEGVMLRQACSLYVTKRSSTLLKVKSFQDAEATVTAHLPGKGRHVGRLGALSCTWLGGSDFDVGTGFSDTLRDSPPPVGAIITFRYQELTRDGVPRFPVYVTVRDYE